MNKKESNFIYIIGLVLIGISFTLGMLSGGLIGWAAVMMAYISCLLIVFNKINWD